MKTPDRVVPDVAPRVQVGCCKEDWVFLDERARVRIVVPEVIVIEPGGCVVVAGVEAERLADGFNSCFRLAVRRMRVFRRDGARVIVQRPDGRKVVGGVVVRCGGRPRRAVPFRQRQWIVDAIRLGDLRHVT